MPTPPVCAPASVSAPAIAPNPSNVQEIEYPPLRRMNAIRPDDNADDNCEATEDESTDQNNPDNTPSSATAGNIQVMSDSDDTGDDTADEEINPQDLEVDKLSQDFIEFRKPRGRPPAGGTWDARIGRWVNASGQAIGRKQRKRKAPTKASKSRVKRVGRVVKLPKPASKKSLSPMEQQMLMYLYRKAADNVHRAEQEREHVVAMAHAVNFDVQLEVRD